MSTRALLYENEVLGSLQATLARARRVDIAMALVTMPGLRLIRSQLTECLRGGGKVGVLFGIDLPTDPEAIGLLLDLRTDYPGALVIRRFKSPSARWFHPKVFLCAPFRGRSCAIVGSSNLTGGGLEKNYEASIWTDDRSVCRGLAKYFEELFDGGYAADVTQAWLREYTRVFKQRMKVEKKTARVRDQARRLSERHRSGKLPTSVKGKKFVFTGGITDWPRQRRLYPRVRRAGAIVGETQSSLRGAAALVQGDKLGEDRITVKLRRARALGIPMMSADEFLAML